MVQYSFGPGGAGYLPLAASPNRFAKPQAANRRTWELLWVIGKNESVESDQIFIDLRSKTCQHTTIQQ